VPHRQYVLTVPKVPRGACHQRHRLGELCRIVGRLLTEAYREAGLDGQPGFILFVQAQAGASAVSSRGMGMVSCGKGQGGQARGAVSGSLSSLPPAAAESRFLSLKFLSLTGCRGVSGAPLLKRSSSFRRQRGALPVHSSVGHADLSGDSSRRGRPCRLRLESGR